MAYINKIQIDNRNEYLIEPTLYTITEGTSSAYIADIPDFELVLGVSIKIRAHVNNAEKATLNINNLGAKNIIYNSGRIAADSLKEDNLYTLVYDGTEWQLIGDAYTAIKLYDTPNNTSTFLRGDNTWSSTITDTLKISTYDNILTLGAIDSSAAHIYNSSDIPFLFNNEVSTITGGLGSSTYPWADLHLSGDIYYKGTKAEWSMIRFINNTVDQYGNGIVIGGGGQTIIGGGESASTLTGQTITNGEKLMWIANDGDIELFPGQQNGFNNAYKTVINTQGILIGIDGNTTKQSNLIVQSGAGRIALFSRAALDGERGLQVYAHGTGSTYPLISVDTNNISYLQGNSIGIRNTDPTTGHGISLYNGTANGVPTYGMFFGGTSTFGTFGDVTSNWATYFTTSRNNDRGWIFKSNGAEKNSNNNYASISGRGHFTASLTECMWIDGQRSTNAAYNIANYDSLTGYNPWMRATNTYSSGTTDAKVGRWFTFGTQGSSFCWAGSVTSRTANGVDNIMRYDISNGILTVSQVNGNASTASKLTDITSADAASATNTWRRVWFSYDNNTMGRPSYSDKIAYQTSTGALKVGRIHCWPSEGTNNFSEGLRIHTASNNWGAITLCGAENTGDIGTSENTWGIFNNNGILYINKNGSNAATKSRAWATSNGWTFGNSSTNDYALNCASFICDTWVRTTGNTGWYNETHSGGWYMTDTKWIRSYNNKPVLIDIGSNNRYGIKAHSLALGLSGAEYASLMLKGGSTMYGFAVNKNGYWYMGKRTSGSFENTTGDSYIYYGSDAGIFPSSNNTASLGADDHYWKECKATNFYGTFNGTASAVLRATFGDASNGEHDANNIVSNGLYYYNANGPSTSNQFLNTNGAIYCQAQNTSQVGQIAQDYRTGGLAVRGKNSGTWTNWLGIPMLKIDTYPTLLNSDGKNTWIKIGTANDSYGLLPSQGGTTGNGHNYLGTSNYYWKAAYIDTVYGKLTGNASSATTLQNARLLWGNSFNGSANVDGTISLGDEAKVDARTNRKKTNGGGWAFTPLRVLDNTNLDFAHIGVLGNANNLTYIYIGANNYDGNNLRITSNGEVRIPVTTAASNKTTGALVVGGGAGFGGEIYANKFNGPLSASRESVGKFIEFFQNTITCGYLELEVLGAVTQSAPNVEGWTSLRLGNDKKLNVKDNASGKVYLSNSNGVWIEIKGMYGTLAGSAKNYININNWLNATGVTGAVWNDYAEFRKTNKEVKAGQAVIDNDDGSLSITNKRLMPGAQIVSDTFGFSIGETEEAKTPLAVSGRVLVYTYRPREEYHAGMAVCSAPNGTIDIMTREEIQQYPDAIIGIVSEIPEYEEWGTGKVKVNGRIWIKIK